MAKFLFTGFSFFFTIVLGAFAFAFTAMTYPSTMRQLMAGAEQLRNQLSALGIPDTYMVWVDILLQGDNIVLMGFIVLARIFVALVGSLFGRSGGDGRPPVWR
jgi:hypothetical protein